MREEGGEAKLYGGVARLEGAEEWVREACGAHDPSSSYDKAGLYDPERKRRKA